MTKYRSSRAKRKSAEANRHDGLKNARSYLPKLSPQEVTHQVIESSSSIPLHPVGALVE